MGNTANSTFSHVISVQWQSIEYLVHAHFLSAAHYFEYYTMPYIVKSKVY